MISRLEEANKFKVNTKVDLKIDEIRWLVNEAKMIFSNTEDTLLEIEGPLMVTGDFHG